MVFHKSEDLEIFYYPSLKMVETRWLQFAPSREYRRGLEHYLDAITRNDVRLWLGDYRLARVIRKEDQDWAAKEWFPKFLPYSNKIERMARVQSYDFFSEHSSGKIKEKLDTKGLPFLFSEFKNYDDARAWLLGN